MRTVLAGLVHREATVDRIHRELERARAFMRSSARDAQWFLVTSEAMSSPVPVVVAVGWVEVARAPRPAALDDTSTSALPGVMTVSVGQHDVGGRPTLVRHDLLVGADDVVRERVVALGYDDAAGVRIAMEVSTSDLAAFADLTASATSFLAAFQWGGQA
ncbi:hypothetical protein [Nocardioides flavescens]|uniref:Uncharacterized protein n=1 Tax=Nocardioides flavescens TaxID=2691959 RepID=A0A6L7F1A3_9ACTN|nr:hypothetical protein [Nocardioides flavescens]MXG90899.1 hypothetical protein [Nocardioides flavescens]